MSTTQDGRVPTSATAGDCVRLWTYLTTDFIPALRMEVRMVTDPRGDAWLSVEVVDDSAQDDRGEQLVNVWASREFRNGLYLISVSQLFDLLIEAHRKIDGFFSKGSPFAPTLRRK
jgi:hypothetical protein